MPRRISTILSSSTDNLEPHVESMEATIFRIWRTAFPHLPHHFGPAWSYDLDIEHKHRAKLRRNARDTSDPNDADRYYDEIRDVTRQIRRTVRQNKRIIILTIIDAFSPDRITTPDFQFSECCSNHHTASDTRIRNLLSALQSDDSQLAQLCAIVNHIPHAHLTRVLGQLFIRRFPHLQCRPKKNADRPQIDQAVVEFIKRSHWHCRCGSMCSQMKHSCPVR